MDAKKVKATKKSFMKKEEPLKCCEGRTKANSCCHACCHGNVADETASTTASAAANFAAR